MVLLLPKMFEFAAPPRTGVRWFVRACQEADLEMIPSKISVSVSFLPWTKRAEKDVLRVSLVRHPCDWLRSVFDGFQTMQTEVSQRNQNLRRLYCRGFNGLPEDSFDEFVIRYLQEKLGLIGRIFDSYRTDTRMRLEDIPWAFVELLESFDVKQKGLDEVVTLSPQEKTLSRSRWRSDLREQVLESEAEFCRDLDYY